MKTPDSTTPSDPVSGQQTPCPSAGGPAHTGGSTPFFASSRSLLILARTVVELVECDARHGGNFAGVQNTGIWKEFKAATHSTPFPATEAQAPSVQPMQNESSTAPTSVPPPAARSGDYREGYEQAKREAAQQIESLRGALIYIDRQVREVWPETGSTTQQTHRRHAISVANQALTAQTPTPYAGEKAHVPLVDTHEKEDYRERAHAWEVTFGAIYRYLEAEYLAEYLAVGKDAMTGEQHAVATIARAAAELKKLRADLNSARNDLRHGDAAYAMANQNIENLKGSLAEADKLTSDMRTALSLARARIDQLTEERNQFHEDAIKANASRYKVGIDPGTPGGDMSVETTFRQGADGKWQLVGWRVLDPSQPVEPEPVKWEPKSGDRVIHRKTGAFGKLMFKMGHSGMWAVNYDGESETLHAEELSDIVPAPVSG